MKIGRCDHCNARIRDNERRYLDLPARNGEPAMGIPDGGCVRCCPTADEQDRDDNAMWEGRISEDRGQ